MIIKSVSSLGMMVAGVVYMASANAGSVVQCGQDICSANFAINSGNKQVGGGEFTYDAETGEISLSSQNITGGV